MNWKRILVPLDGSEVAETALTIAVDLAKTWGAKVFLVRVTEALLEHAPAPIDTCLAPVYEAEAYLEEVRRRIASAGVEATAAVWYGPPAAAVMKAAQYHEIDLIVMTTRGRGGVELEVFGSVAESILRGIPIPILVLHQRVPAFSAAGEVERATPRGE